MTKIAIVIETLNIGGAEKSLINLLNNVNLNNFQVDLILHKRGGILEKDLPKEIKVSEMIILNYSLFDRIKFFFNKKMVKKNKYNQSQIYWKNFKKLFQPIEKNYDIAIAYHQGFPTYFMMDKMKSKIKIGWMNTDYKKANYNTNFDINYFRKIDKIVAVSQSAKETFLESYKEVFSFKTIVIEDYIDRKRILYLAKEESIVKEYDGLKIVTVGRLHESKGYDLAIEAAKYLKEKNIDFKWFFIGEGDKRSDLEKMISINNLVNNIVLVGADYNPYKYIKDSDIYVQPSVFEGYSISVREAMILNKPIICTNFPSITGTLIDGENALIVRMNGYDIFEKIIYLINNKTYCEKLVNNLEIENNHFIDNYSDLILNLIKT